VVTRQGLWLPPPADSAVKDAASAPVLQLLTGGDAPAVTVHRALFDGFVRVLHNDEEDVKCAAHDERSAGEQRGGHSAVRAGRPSLISAGWQRNCTRLSPSCVEKCDTKHAAEPSAAVCCVLARCCMLDTSCQECAVSAR
jgi:hypothetical protein